METLEAISKRTSLKRRLSARDVEEEKIAKILDAARLAPSAGNKQPWRFIVVRGKEAVENLVTRAFSEGNLVAREAPIIIIACANPSDDIVRDGKEYYLFDVALAVENMLLAATDLGLATHPMTGVNEDEVKKILGIPDEVRFVAATPVAYPSEGSYEEASQERLSQRTRKDMQELVYSNAWGRPF
ncbi:nitroreductase family protein [Chloroflexota bacterium]